MDYENIESIEIPLNQDSSKKIDEKAIKILEKFLKNEYIVELTTSVLDDLPMLRITKK